jgi:hypothetical protein
MDDRAMSELMGYTVLVAIVSIAATGLLAGSMGTLSSSEKLMEFTGSANALRSFGDITASAARDNNTYPAAFEMSVPRGYDLTVRDMHDDFRSLSLSSGSGRLAHIPIGSVAIESSLRSVAYEGGAIISNDTGMTGIIRNPGVRVITSPSGKKSLYISIVSISSGSFVRHPGPVTLYIKCSSVRPMSWHIPDGYTVTVSLRSGSPRAWGEKLESSGFTTVYQDGEVKGSTAGISDVYIVYAEADISAQ